ncbi:MAG: IclR family transcriptional regulator [Dehalococcoidales bacterium]|nr:IclR family transcriptional regulator [Dehalococcoidales bacterium]
MRFDSLSKSVERTVSVLKCFTPANSELTPAELARSASIPKTTIYRITMSLTKAGLLEYNTKTKKYMVGPELYFLGSLYLSSTDIIKAAGPVIKELNRLTGEAINVSIFDKGHAILIMKEESESFFRFAVNIGTIIPAHASSMGKIFLSEFTDEEIDALYPDEELQALTQKTITSKKKLKKDLRQVRKTGISFSNGGTYEGLFGIAALIRDSSGKGVAALSINIPTVKGDLINKEKLAGLTKMGAKLISYRLGYRDSSDPVRNIEDIHSWLRKNNSGL